MVIGLYEEWMRPQVSEMFSSQYGILKEDFETLCRQFYEHPFQKDKCIRIVALEEKRVIGFQSFFYWPYTLGSKTYNSYQSGNSLVHPDFRGKGIFQKMLEYLDEHRVRMGVDFLIGFPIDASRNSLLTNRWKNLFNLKWQIRLMNPFSFASPVNIAELKAALSDTPVSPSESQEVIRLSEDQGFLDWRTNYSEKNIYGRYTYKKNNGAACFTLKLNRRNFFITELIIGNFEYSSASEHFINESLASLISKIRPLRFITMLSIAMNDRASSSLLGPLSDQGFRKINREIYFMVKLFVPDQKLNNPGIWNVYRHDIDTW